MRTVIRSIFFTIVFPALRWYLIYSRHSFSTGGGGMRLVLKVITLRKYSLNCSIYHREFAIRLSTKNPLQKAGELKYFINISCRKSIMFNFSFYYENSIGHNSNSVFPIISPQNIVLFKKDRQKKRNFFGHIQK